MFLLLPIPKNVRFSKTKKKDFAARMQKAMIAARKIQLEAMVAAFQNEAAETERTAAQ